MNKRKLNLKWFGSLTNLSIRRPSSKANDKAAPVHDGSLGGDTCATAVGDKWVDDMEQRFHSPGYARSSDMYTHVGTVPRGERQRKNCGGAKKKKKNKKEEEEGVSGGQSLWKAGDHVQASPLLSALSSLTLSTLDQRLHVSARARPLPAARTLTRTSPLTPMPEGCVDPVQSRGSQDASEGGRAVRTMATDGPTVVPSQDVYVPMDPIAEAACDNKADEQKERRPVVTATQEPRNAAHVSQEVASIHSRCDLTHGGGEYVKFSKEQFWLEPPTEKQRKHLEEELELSGTNLKSHAWYHGGIPWEVSENLVVNHGDFLIRDSQSSPEDFVLTSRWEQETLHFLIRKSVVQPSEMYSRVKFSLDGEAFDTLPALVHYYVGSRAALARWSGAQVLQPVNRTLPLSDLEAAFCSTIALPPRQGLSGEEKVRPRSPSPLHHSEVDICRRQDGQSLLPRGEFTLSSANSNNTPRPRSPCSSQAASGSTSTSPFGNFCGAQPTSSSTGVLSRKRDQPGPDQDPEDGTSDVDRSCYTELYPGPQSYVGRLQAEEGPASFLPLRVEDGHFSPVVEAVSSFKPGRYWSLLMSKENKPLEVGILRRVKDLLAETDPRTVAQHITKADCMVARILEVTPEVQRMMGVSSGMELLTLPHGQQLRQDLLERFQTMATTLAMDVLGCTGTNEERAALLHKIIQIAAELKNTMGNMFGFAAVMRALELPQVSRLEQTWTTLRQRHTEGAILYEKTLRPFIKSLNVGRESCQLSNTTVPHILPLLSLLERSAAVSDGTEPWEMVEVGVDVVMFHLGAARTMAQLGGIYQSNAEKKLQGFQEQAEVLELFLTDFQLRLLWGSRGATENQALRYAKFEQVLTALSNKLEPPVRLR